MKIEDLIYPKKENPIENIVPNGGFCRIFRTIACVGDSLSSGELESMDESGKREYHDMYEYSWGQYMARTLGNTVHNFSKGGMTAKEFCESFAKINNFWDSSKKAQAYIIAMGVNDITNYGENLGKIDDIDFVNYENNADSFVGYYAKIIQKYKELQPKAKFFLMTMPKWYKHKDRDAAEDRHRELLYEMTKVFDNTYVLDLRKYAPYYDEAFEKKFFLGGHMNPCGYILTAEMVMTYIDYIIRNNMEDFSQIGFVGTEYHNASAKW